MVLKDFECKCGISEHAVRTTDKQRWCGICHTYGKVVFTKSAAVHGCDSFNPHYDQQLGSFFKSKEEKQAFMKDKGFKQESGSSSPRRSTNDRVICSSRQAKAL